VKAFNVRSKQLWGEIRWIVIASLWFLSLILGFLGFSIYSEQNGLGFTTTDQIYRTLQLISMNSGAVDGKINWLLNAARFLLPSLTAYTAFQAFIDLFLEQATWIKLWGLDQHFIVCGLGRKGRYLVNGLQEEGKKIVVIERNIDHVIAKDYRQRGVELD